MEHLLDLYEMPYDPRYPVVCFDESNKQLVEETRSPQPVAPGRAARFDYEYRRHGTRNLFLFFEPLAGWRHVVVTQRRTAYDFAQQMRWLADVAYPDATCINIVLDNLNTHKPAALYQTFPPAEARRLLRRLVFHYTPKHGSWLNMAEIEFSALGRQCLAQRIPDEEQLTDQIQAWTDRRNAHGHTVNWQFTTADARIKLKKLYPSIDA